MKTSTQPDRDVPLGARLWAGMPHLPWGWLFLVLKKNRPVRLGRRYPDEHGRAANHRGEEPGKLLPFHAGQRVYATTGGQPVPNAKNIAYHVIAQGSGYPSTYAFDNLEDFANNIEGILKPPRPRVCRPESVPGSRKCSHRPKSPVADQDP